MRHHDIVRNVTGRRLVAMAILASLAAGAYVLARLFRENGWAWAANFSGVASFTLTAFVALLPVTWRMFGWLGGRLPLSQITIAQARDDLAAALELEWAEEDRLRQLNDPRPLPVRWEVMPPGQAGRNGVFGDIHDVFTAIPGRRLVIVGAAGAGKSALAIKLVRDLLAARGPGEPVPLLLPVGSWTADEAMPEWIAGQLVRSHPGLAVRISIAVGSEIPLPRALADGGIVPVLDGLDELPQARRGQVIAEINAYGSDKALVLTSRPDEYAQAVAARPVARAVVVELRPLRLAEVEDYLREATPYPDRWQPVFASMEHEPDGALASTLANPLMLWLARTVYAEADPAELADGRVPVDDGPVIEAHLLREFVPAVYRSRPRQSGPREFRCDPRQATRWLGFLAAQLARTSQSGTSQPGTSQPGTSQPGTGPPGAAPAGTSTASTGMTDIAWWRLSQAEIGWSPLIAAARAAVYGGAAWWLLVWALTRRGYWRHGHLIRQFRYSDLLLSGPLGRAVRPLTDAGLRDLYRVRFLPEAKHLADDVIGFGPWWWMAGLAMLAGFFYALFVLIPGQDDDATALPKAVRLTWRTVLRWASNLALLFVVTLAAWLVANSAWRARYPEVAGLLHPDPVRLIAAWLLLAWARWALRQLRAASDVSVATSPRTLLRQDRNASALGIVMAVISVGITWLWAGPVLAIASAALKMMAFVRFFFLGGEAGAWQRYYEARFRLAIRGRLPWRALTFLADAHRRGVLRQAGAVYEFRHIRLQEQLAGGYSPWPPALAPLAASIGAALARAKAAATARILAPCQVVVRSVNIRLREWANDVSTPLPTVLTTGEDDDVFTAAGMVRVQSARSALAFLAAVATITVAVALGLFSLSVVPAALSWILLVVLVIFEQSAFRLIQAGRNMLLRRYGGDVAPGAWSVRVTPDFVELTLAGLTVRLAGDHIESLELRPVRDAGQHATPWFAVLARPRPGLAGTELFCLPDGCLPVYWLLAGEQWLLPAGLVRALDRCAGGRFGTNLAAAREVLAAGDGEFARSWDCRRQSVLTALGAWLIGGATADLLLLVISFMAGPGELVLLWILAGLWLTYNVVTRLGDQRFERTELPGRWTLQVSRAAIELTIDAETVRLTPGDITETALRTIESPVIGYPTYEQLLVRLRADFTAPVPAPDGWLTVYWARTSGTEPPDGLLAAFAAFAGPHLDDELGEKIRARRAAASSALAASRT
jgi:NACHT domain